MPEVEKKLGSSPDGLSQAEAKKRLAQYGPNEIEEKKTNPLLKFLTYFWGPIPWMIEAAVILSGVVRHWPDFFIILVVAARQRRGRVLGGAPGGQRHRRVEGQAGDQGPGDTGRQVDHPGGPRTGARRCHPPAPGRHRAGRCAPARRRPMRGGPVGADRRIAAGHAQTGRGGVFRLDHPPGRDRCAGLCHRRQYLFRQDRRTGAGRPTPSAISSAPCSRSATT